MLFNTHFLFGTRYLLLIIFAAILPTQTLIAQKQKKTINTPAHNPLSNINLNALKFRSIGPAIKSGRIADFAVNPNNKSEFYVATGSSGVWKTNNAGTTWTPVFDKEGAYSIGCITIDPKNPNILWVGTGENNNQRSVGYGDGIYKSVDGGTSWQNMGLENSEHIGMITIDPENTNIVYVAAGGPLWSEGGDRGLYKTVDGGKKWEYILNINKHTGIIEVHMDPENNTTLYAVAHQRRRHVYTLIDGGPSSSLYKSTDAGKNWRRINTGLPTGDLGRIGMDISPANPSILYAIVEASDENSGFFKSTDKGETWTKQSNYSSSNGGNYYQEIICDPVNQNLVYSMDFHITYTEDGGRTFKDLGDKNKHVDNHALWIDPQNPNYLLSGNDGGVYQSYDKGLTWHFSQNLPITQFYRVSVDNELPFYNIFGGTQDNATLHGPSRTFNKGGIYNADWILPQGGDGFEAVADPKDPNILFVQAQYGYLSRFNRKTGVKTFIQPQEKENEEGYRWNWDAPLIISKHNHLTVYFAANKLFKSTDHGNSWQVISGDLSRGLDRNKFEVMKRSWSIDAVAKHRSTSPFGNITCVEESPFERGTLVIGTDDGLIQITTNDGKDWKKTNVFPGIPDMTYVNDVLFSAHDKNTFYVVFNNHKRGDFKPYILKTKDMGKSWTSITNNLPKRGSVYSIAEDHEDPNLLFGGTEFGFFTSLNGGKDWKQIKNGLPTIAIKDIAIQQRENDVVVASFGRGFYVLDDYSSLRALNSDTLDKEAHIFPIKKGIMFEKTTHKYGGEGSLGDGHYGAQNPEYGVNFTYHLKHSILSIKEIRLEREKTAAQKNVSIPIPNNRELAAEIEEITPYLIFQITDQSGKLIRKLRTKPLPGLNRINWDLTYAKVEPTKQEENHRESGKGDYHVTPGNYEVTLLKSVNGKVTKLDGPVKFRIESIDTYNLSTEDYAAYNQYLEKIKELERVVQGSVNLIQELQNKTNHFKTALKYGEFADEELLDQIIMADKNLTNLNKTFNGDIVNSKLGIWSAPSIVNRLYFAKDISPFRKITEAQREAYTIITKSFTQTLNELKSLAETEIPAIEKKLEQLNAPITPGRVPSWSNSND